MKRIKIGRAYISPLIIPAFICAFLTEGAKSFCVILFAAIIHETGHIIAAYATGARISGIYVNPLSAKILTSKEGKSFDDELKIVLAGPIFGLLAAGTGAVILIFFKNAFLLLFVLANLFFTAVNLIPLKDNDGYCALKILAEKKYELLTAERIMKAAGLIFALLFCAAALILTAKNPKNASLAIVILLSVLPF